MRISDWSSDVCSPDLKVGGAAIDLRFGRAREQRRIAGERRDEHVREPRAKITIVHPERLRRRGARSRHPDIAAPGFGDATDPAMFEIGAAESIHAKIVAFLRSDAVTLLTALEPPRLPGDIGNRIGGGATLPIANPHHTGRT